MGDQTRSTITSSMMQAASIMANLMIDQGLAMVSRLLCREGGEILEKGEEVVLGRR
jgi:hypothetical protein